MTVAEFKKKWLRYKGKETSAYQEHFNDLCRLLEQKTPAEADPSGSDWFCFQKRVVKDQELFAVEADGAEPEASERGFADVWRKDCFAWEYKGKRKNLDEAYKQLLRYRESLLNPPLLVVCDFERFIIRTNFNGTVQETYDFDLTRIDEPRNWRVLRALFSDPESLKPVRTTAEVTEALAGHISVQIGYLQWRRDNGFDNDRSPVLQNLDGFRNEDALLEPHFGRKARNLKEARADEHIRGGVNRQVLEQIKESGDIFFAISDRDWVLNGAAVHVSMIGFDNGAQANRSLDGRAVSRINANLTSESDVTTAATLKANEKVCFIGSKKAGEFEVDEPVALEWLAAPNPHGKPNSDVLKPWVNGNALVTTRRAYWIIDAGLERTEADMSGYALPFERVVRVVKPDRAKNKELRTKRNYWIHKRPGPELRVLLARQRRCLAVVRHSKHLLFSWMLTTILPDDGIYVFAREDDEFFGVLASDIHRVWALAQGTQVREKESGFRYTPETCFETFPFPFSLKEPLPQGESTPQSEAEAAHHYFAKEDPAPYGTAAHRAAISAAAKELNDLRERWLNPPEWTKTVTQEFPGSIGGPWARFIDPKTVNAKTGLGTVRYPRLEPRDDACAPQLKKRTLTNLYNERPAWLDLAHKKLDAAVAAAYGWPADLTDGQILEKLLALNLERTAEEARAAAAPRTRRPQREKHADELI